MGRKQVPGPGQDGEELGSSPSSSPGRVATARSRAAARHRRASRAGSLRAGRRMCWRRGRRWRLAAVTGGDGAGLWSLGDLEVLEVVAAGARMAAWAAWVQTVGLAEFGRRRLGAIAGSRAARRRPRKPRGQLARRGRGCWTSSPARPPSPAGCRAPWMRCAAGGCRSTRRGLSRPRPRTCRPMMWRKRMWSWRRPGR